MKEWRAYIAGIQSSWFTMFMYVNLELQIANDPNPGKRENRKIMTSDAVSCSSVFGDYGYSGTTGTIKVNARRTMILLRICPRRERRYHPSNRDECEPDANIENDTQRGRGSLCKQLLLFVERSCLTAVYVTRSDQMSSEFRGSIQYFILYQ
jgi:hypothetical protein